MDKLGWSDKLSTGLAEIDDDHKTLFDYLYALEVAVRDHKGGEMARGILGGLRDYAKYHFNREEAIFTKHQGYKLVAFHLEQHRQFAVQMEKFEEQLSASIDVSAEMVAYLSKWLVRHIMTEDKVFFDSYTPTSPT
jgi:hemerythrin